MLEILIPKREKDWFVLITNKGIYELRFGGVKKVDKINFNAYKQFAHKVVMNTITGVWTDNETVYILLSNGELLEHGWSILFSDGTKSNEIRIINKKVYEENEYEKLLAEDCVKLF